MILYSYIEQCTQEQHARKYYLADGLGDTGGGLGVAGEVAGGKGDEVQGEYMRRLAGVLGL